MRTIVFSLALVSGIVLTTDAQTREPEAPPDTLYRVNPTYWSRLAEWDARQDSSALIVMLGNSITEGGDWSTLLDRSDVVNRGIGSDNVAGFLQRMEYVTRLHPRLCFVMGGINDIYAGFEVSRILRNYTWLIDSLRQNGITPVVQSTLFASPKWHHAAEKNVLVTELNAGLQDYCEAHNVLFVDLNAGLAPGGVLADRYTTDGIHLSPAGYMVWSQIVTTLLHRELQNE